MSGPALELVLPRSEQDIEPVLRKIITDRAQQVEGDNFWMDGRPFGVWFGEENPGELDEIRTSDFSTVVGWEPAGLVGVAAFCSTQEDHHLLASLLLSFTKRTGGVVDLDGCVLPPGEAPDHPGKLWQVTRGAPSDPCPCQYCDAEFLQWLTTLTTSRLVT